MRAIFLFLFVFISSLTIEGFTAAGNDDRPLDEEICSYRESIVRQVEPLVRTGGVTTRPMKDLRNRELEGFIKIFSSLSSEERSDLIQRAQNIKVMIEQPGIDPIGNFSTVLFFAKIPMVERDGLEKTLSSILRHHRGDDCNSYEYRTSHSLGSFIFGNRFSSTDVEYQFSYWGNSENIQMTKDIILSMSRVPNLVHLKCEEVYGVLENIAKYADQREAQVALYQRAFDVFEKIPAKDYKEGFLYGKFLRGIGSSRALKVQEALLSFVSPGMTDEQCNRVLDLFRGSDLLVHLGDWTQVVPAIRAVRDPEERIALISKLLNTPHPTKEEKRQAEIVRLEQEQRELDLKTSYGQSRDLAITMRLMKLEGIL